MKTRTFCVFAVVLIVLMMLNGLIAERNSHAKDAEFANIRQELERISTGYQGEAAYIRQELGKINSGRYVDDAGYLKFHIETIAKEARKTVATGLTTWESLGTSEDQLDKMVDDATVCHIKQELERITSGYYGDDNKGFIRFQLEYVAEGARKAVASGLTTWEGLGTSDDELSKMVNDAIAAHTQRNSV